MEDFWQALGYGEFSEEQRTRAKEAHALLNTLQGAQDATKAIHIWESLEKELPGNLAVSYRLYSAASFELQKPFYTGSPTLVWLQATTARAENTIRAAIAAKPDDSAINIIYARMLCTQWSVKYIEEVNQQKRASQQPYSLPESSVLLAPMRDAFAKAHSSVVKEKKFEPALRQAVTDALQTICSRPFSGSAGVDMALADCLLALKFEPEPVTPNFEQLYREAKTLEAAAGRLKDKELAGRCRHKALERYRQIVRLENVPLKYNKGLLGERTDNIYTSALLDAMAFLAGHAREEADMASRQALIEESLGITRKYLAQESDGPDSWEGGYGPAWHYMALAEVAPFKEKKAAYAKLARERIVYNISFGEEHPATEFWAGILADFDSRMLTDGED